MPTTYVWSDGDVAIGRTAAEACADYVTGDYRFVELPGITHWIPEQAPDQLAAAILDRIASAPTASRAREAARARTRSDAPGRTDEQQAERRRRVVALTPAVAGSGRTRQGETDEDEALDEKAA